MVNSTLSGLLVSKDFTYTFLSPSDLRDFTGLSTSVIMQRQRIKVAVTWDLVRWHLRGMYGKIEEALDKDRVPTMRVLRLPSFTMIIRLNQTHAPRSCQRWILKHRVNLNYQLNG